MLASGLLLLSLYANGGEGGLEARLTAMKDDSTRLSLTITNISPEPLGILRWRLPTSGRIDNDLFEVVFLGDPPVKIDYTGRRVKRLPPEASDYIVLAAGAAITRELDIADFYATTYAGNYSVRFSTSVATVVPGRGKPSRPDAVSLTSNTLVVNQPFPRAALRAPVSAATENCSAADRRALTSALEAARLIAEIAATDLQTLPQEQRPESPRYAWWFGEYTPKRYARVSDSFDAISHAAENANVDFICSASMCEPGIIAYVFPSRAYDIYLCNLFFALNTTGSSAQAGVIVHELSHFSVVADTEDFIYGKTGARHLAVTNPGKAVRNADNYEFFAENTPPLAIGKAGSGPLSLDPGDTVSGTLQAGEWAYYKVSGVSVVELSGLNADLDLYIGEDGLPTESSFACRPYSGGTAPERCNVDPDETIYIGVRAFDGGSYTLTVRLEAFTTLPLDTPVAGTLSSAAWDYYEVSGAGSVRLYDLTADLDLYVSLTGAPDKEGYSCRPYLSGTTEETCALDPSRTAFIGVNAFAAGSYTLEATGAATGGPIDVDGSVTSGGGVPLCALVLISGRYTFTCGGNGLPPGSFSFTGLPREANGTANLQVYADGFLPHIDRLAESSTRRITMARSGSCPNYNAASSPATDSTRAGEVVTLSGNVLLGKSSVPVCAMVLANGRYRFSCDAQGSFKFDAPLDDEGQIKLQVYADGFAPYIERFDPGGANRTVRLARASECR